MAKKPYVEPDGYFPDEILKEAKLGKYNDNPPFPEKLKKEDDEENKKIRKFVKGE